MKIVEWSIEGMVVEYAKRIKANGKPSPRYEKWVEACSNVIGAISKPIGYVDVCEIRLMYNKKLPRTNSDRASAIQDMLIRCNVIESASYDVMPDTRQMGRYYQMWGGVKVKLRIDESHPLNQGINWKEFPVIKEWV
jgi:hypothetical protein